MKISKGITLVFLGLLCSCSTYNKNDGTITESMESSSFSQEISIKNAHPNAQKHLKEDFFWSSMEASSPFGSDSGNDTYYIFMNWRKTHPNDNTVDFLVNEIKKSGFPEFDIYSLDPNIMADYVNKKLGRNDNEKQKTKEQIIEGSKSLPKEIQEQMGLEHLDEAMEIASNGMGMTYLTEINNIIISSGFSQIVCEGKISPDLAKLTNIAIERELSPILLSNWGEYSATRKKQLLLLLKKIEIFNSNKNL